VERRVIVITGPTCSGKTFLSILLARKLETEIISADSRQIYKQLSIGTAKPAQSELSQVKHHFIDFLEPVEEYNVNRFETDALKVIDEITAQNKIPVVVGGSGLYIKGLVDGIFDTVDANDEYRKELLEVRRKHGDEYLYDLLKQADPASAEKMLPQNWKRVMRALEVIYLSGRPIWQLQKEHKRESNFVFHQYGLNWERAVLYKNIEMRVDEMIESGLVEEVESLLNNGLDANLNSLNTVGYKEIISFLKEEITLDRAIELIKRNTRRYAKRQMTWFRKDKRIKWFDINCADDLTDIADKIIEEMNKPFL